VRDGWSSVELRSLATLAAVGRERSFSRAAETLGYTQSAVSQQIGRLERLVGHHLVDRPGGPRPVSLTAAGEVLVGHADAIVARLASASADLAAIADGTAGLLRVGCYQSVGVRIIPRVLHDYSTAWPDVRVRLTEAEDDGELLHLVERGELDVTFVAFPILPGPFTAVELMADPYVVVVRDDSSLHGQSGSIAPSDLAGMPLITYGPMRDVHAIENRLGRPELAEQIVLRSNDNGTIAGLAAEGIGAAIISWLSVDLARPGLRVMPLAGVSPRIVGVAWHRDRNRIEAAKAFVRTCHVVAQLEQQQVQDTLMLAPTKT